MFPGGSDGNAFAYSAGDLDSIPGSGRSSGEGKGYSLLYSCLENSMDRGACGLLSIGLQRVGHNKASNTPVPAVCFLLLKSIPLDGLHHILFFSLLKNT